MVMLVDGMGARAPVYRPPAEDASPTSGAGAPSTPANNDSAPAADSPPPTDVVREGAAEATTTQAAVAAIHALPLPRTDDLAGLSGPVADAIYAPRVEQFNATRAEQAQAALDRLAPQREDFSTLNGATANFEYQEAQRNFRQDPYAQELQRIVDESTAQPGSVPAYLEPSTSPVDAQGLPLEQMTDALGMLGIELPANPSPAQVQAGYEVVASLPDDVLGWALNPGSRVSFETPLAGIGTPGLPARVNADVRVIGEVELSDVQTDMNFEQSQTFEMSVQLQGTVEAAVGKTLLNRLYGWADRHDKLTDGARTLVEGSPLLRNIVKGLPIPVSVAYEQFSGTRVTYEATVPPQDGSRIASGDLTAAPNPLDPMGMPIGSSVLIRGQTLEGSAFAASYKLLTLDSTHTELSGQGFGVTRVDENTVEIISGPVDTVENDLFLGIGRRGLASIGIDVEKSSELQSMSVARIDLRTEEGQAAYQAFMSSGSIPDWSPPGVTRSGTTDIYIGEHSAGIGANLGGLSWTQEFNSSETIIRRTTWQDGTVEQTNSFRINNDHLAEVGFQLDAQGRVIEGSTRYQVLLANYDPALASYLDSAMSADGETRDFEGNQHVRLEFSESQLMALRDVALEHVEQTGRGELIAQIEAGSAASSDFDVQLAMAKTPDEVFSLVSNDFFQFHMAENLLGMRGMTGREIPGDLVIRDAGS